MHSINDWNKPNVFSETKSFGIIVLKKTALNKFAVREKGNCKKTCETYWAYYGKYAGPSIQNTDPICKVYITENIYMDIFDIQGDFFNWPPPKSNKYKKVDLG